MILTLLQQNEFFDSKLFQGKHFKLLSGRLTVGSLCKTFPNFYIKWIQIYRKTRYRRVIYHYPNTINIFQLQIYFLNSKMFSKKYFCDSWCKKEMEDKILNSFFGSAKFIYSLSLHISSFPWRLSCHHGDHTRSKFSSLHYQITCKL